MDAPADPGGNVITAMAVVWACWTAIGCWRRRPLPRRWMADDATVVPRSIERFGQSIQQRLGLLTELAPVTVGAVALACLLLVVVSPSVAVTIAACTVLAARARARAQRRAEHRRMAEQVPQALDLLRLCLESGLSTRSALARVGDVIPEPLGRWCRSISTRTGRGAPLADSLLQAARPGHPMELAARTLASAERSGVAVNGALAHLSDEARAAVRRASMERVRRLPVQMLFPLVCCTLPAFLTVAVVPMVLTQLRDVL